MHDRAMKYTLIHRPFPKVFDRAPFPPAFSAFSVRLAFCLCFSALRADLVSYRIFFAIVLPFVLILRASVCDLSRILGFGDWYTEVTDDGGILGGPCMIV